MIGDVGSRGRAVAFRLWIVTQSYRDNVAAQTSDHEIGAIGPWVTITRNSAFVRRQGLRPVVPFEGGHDGVDQRG